MDRIIKVTIKEPYGRQLLYPACPLACAFTDLTGTKTLSKQHLKVIKALGYKIVVVPDKTTQKILRVAISNIEDL